MRKFLLMPAAVLGLAAGPVLAQTAPVTPSTMPDTAPANPGMTGMRSLRGQQHEAVGHHRAIPFSTKHGKAGSTHRASSS